MLKETNTPTRPRIEPGSPDPESDALTIRPVRPPYTKFGPILSILSKNQILTSIKGHNSVANLRKTIIYNTNIDLVNDDVYTKFGLILSIRSQDIE